MKTSSSVADFEVEIPRCANIILRLADTARQCPKDTFLTRPWAGKEEKHEPNKLYVSIYYLCQK